MPDHAVQNDLFDDADDLTGRLLGDRFQVSKLLGQTLTTQRYAALDTSAPTDSRRVVLDMLPPLLASDGQLIRAIENAIESMRVVTHPHFVCPAEIVRADDTTFVVQPYVEGASLNSVLQASSSFAPGDATSLLKPIADALDVAAALGVLHGDVRPENILIATDGRSYLTSALASRLLIDRLIDMNPDALMSALPWLSPETCDGAAPARSQDVYGLGVCMYGLLTGGPPFTDDEVHDKLGIEPPALLPADVAAHVGEVMDALSPAAGDRPKSCRAVIKPPTRVTNTPAIEPIDPSRDKTFKRAVSQASRDSKSYAARERSRQRAEEGLPKEDEPADYNRIAMMGALMLGLFVLAVAGAALWGLSGSKPAEVADDEPTPVAVSHPTPGTVGGTGVKPPVEPADPLPPDDPVDPRDMHTDDPPVDPIKPPDPVDSVDPTPVFTNPKPADVKPDPDPKPKPKPLSPEEKRLQALLGERFALLSVEPAAMGVLGEPKPSRHDKRQGAWPDMPDMLKGMAYTPIDEGATFEAGLRKFTVLNPGVVLMAVYVTGLGDVNETARAAWEDQVLITSKIERDWERVGDLGNFDWWLYARTCKRGEKFEIRTKKFITPLLIFPQDMLPFELRQKEN